MTSATERLRALLTEHGVEWQEHRHVMPGSMAIQRETLWGQPTDAVSGKPIPHVYHYRATEMGDGRLFLEAQLVSPEQAVAATLGPGTCHDEGDPSDFCCSECGVRMFTNTSDTYTMIAADERTIIKHPNFCPNCGKRVVG